MSRYHRGFMIPVLLLTMGVLNSCRSGSEPGTPAAVRIVLGLRGVEVDAFILTRGVEEQLTVDAFDAAGNKMPGPRAVFVSRAPTLVAVSDTGVVRGLEPGSAWIVASVASRGVELRDSIEVRVPAFP
jgi:hypothetical protein